MPEPTTTSSASMGGPLSEAERARRLAEIRSRAEHQLMVDRTIDTIAARDHAAAVDDRAYLLRHVDLLETRLRNSQQCAVRELGAQVRADEAEAERDAARARVGVLEGQLATARAEAVQLNSQLKDPGLDWLIDWAMGTDREARDHYFHINDGEGDSCGCRYADEGALGLDGGDPDA